MARLPLLLFPHAMEGIPSSRKGFPPPSVHKPGVARQKERLGPAFQRLEDAFEARRAELSISVTGMEPEKVLVIETAGSVGDFQRAVENIKGLEWLGEFETDAMEPDEDFYDEKKHDKKIPHTLYLAMTDKRAVEEIVRLWDRWETDKQRFTHGKTKWRDLFKLCRTIRYWSVEDRLSGTGLIERLKDTLLVKPGEPISLEIEFWYRDPDRLRSELEQFHERLSQKDGKIIATAQINEICYGAIKARISAELASQIVNGQYPDFFKDDAVYCLRPEGQCASDIQDSAEHRDIPDRPLPKEPPVVAILDGVPFDRHKFLLGRIELDDPDDFSDFSQYQAKDRKHGTAMASLVIHGELDDRKAQALKSRVYMRPVMKPVEFKPGKTQEEIPSDVLLVDLVHQAVKEIFDRDDGKNFSTIKVINISLGDVSRPFNREPSPWARSLDWLSWKYKVLFCVSAGNFVGNIDLGPPEEFSGLIDADKSERTISAMANTLPDRRLLSPAESMNAITVGSLHRDLAGKFDLKKRIDIQPFDDLPDPVTRLGGGFRNSIKPDILMPGGRQLYVEFPDSASPGRITYRISPAKWSPGQSVASPGAGTGRIDGTTYIRGTSGATALASRGAARIHEALQELQGQNPNAIPDDNLAVLIKALLAHGAVWGAAYDKIQSLKTPANSRTFRQYAARFLGHGAVDIERVLECTEGRATAIGTDAIEVGQKLEYRFPLPPVLSGSGTGRRLTITLAWFTPINHAHRNLRQAKLSFDPSQQENHLGLSRKNADGNQVQRGTVQHEVLEGKRVSAYQDGDYFLIAVTCQNNAGDFDGSVPFGLAVTLEVLDHHQVGIDIYGEIRDRLEAPVATPVVPSG